MLPGGAELPVPPSAGWNAAGRGAPAATNRSGVSAPSGTCTSMAAATGSGTSHGRSTRSASTPERSRPSGRSSPARLARQASASMAAWQAAASSSGMPATSSLTPSPTGRRRTVIARCARFRRRSDAAASRAASSARKRSLSFRTDRAAASGSTAASTAAMTAGWVSRAGQPSSSANVRARGQSSRPAASSASVAVSDPVRVSACPVSVLAVARAQFSVSANSSGKNSLTPAGAVSADAAAPGSPGRRSADAGRSAANAATSSSS